jgi:CheY-like chemotaxis protein
LASHVGSQGGEPAVPSLMPPDAQHLEQFLAVQRPAVVIADTQSLATRWQVGETVAARSVAALAEASQSTAILMNSVPLQLDRLKFVALPASPVLVGPLLEAIVKSPDANAQSMGKTGRFKTVVSAPARFSQVRLLVVEDNPANRHVVGAQLEVLGCRVTFAEDGKQGLAAWRDAAKGNTPFSLILTDLHMPELDGMGLVRAIREAEREHAMREGAASGKAQEKVRVPIVAFTADGSSTTLEDCLAAGMDGALVKPSNLASLEATLLQFHPNAVVEAQDTNASPTAMPNAALHAFVSATEHDLASLADAAGAGDTARIKSLAHRIKGASLYANVPDLTSMAREIESAAPAQAVAEAQARLPAMQRALARFRDGMPS